MIKPQYQVSLSLLHKDLVNTALLLLVDPTAAVIKRRLMRLNFSSEVTCRRVTK